MNSDSSLTAPTAGTRLLRRLLLLVTLPPLMAAVVSFFGKHFFVAELFVNFQLQIAIALAVLALFSLMGGMRRWSMLLVLAAIATTIPLATALAPAENPQAGPRTIKLMSFNVYTVNPTKNVAIDCIKKHDPDIVLIVEYANSWNEHVKNLFDDYPYRIEELRWHGFGITLLSKFELSEKKVIQLVDERTDVPLVVATAKVGDQQINLWGAHLLAPMDPLRMDFRNRQLVEIGDLIGNSSQQPTILLGDFNCVSWSSHMQRLLNRTGLRDSRRGIGYHASWPTDTFFMRIPIDHLFVSDRIHVKSRQVLGETGSDHFPVLMEFSISD